MSDDILLPGGGYQKLCTYRKSLIVFDGTICFCRRFMDSRDRTVDQMVQAARSGKQNIVEGAMASVSSSATEIKLTGVALASRNFMAAIDACRRFRSRSIYNSRNFMAAIDPSPAQTSKKSTTVEILWPPLTITNP